LGVGPLRFLIVMFGEEDLFGGRVVKGWQGGWLDEVDNISAEIISSAEARRRYTLVP